MTDLLDFAGYPREGIEFLSQLAENNNREWFNARKATFQEYVQRPSQDFVVALGQRLKSVSPGVVYDTGLSGSGSILRIYRDTRFSKDKTPYNTYIRVVFWEGTRKKMENPSFFVRISPDGVGVFVGMHVFPKPFLTAYRDAVIDDGLGADLEAALASARGTGDYEIGGQHYKRVPRGYDPEHARAALLRHNGLYAHTGAIGPQVIQTPELVEVCARHCRNMAPLHQWLVTVGGLSDA